MLFGKFAALKTLEDLVSFVTQYGPLTPAGNAGGRGDEVPQILDQAASMTACFNSRKLPAWPRADLKARLSTDKGKGTVSVKIAPAKLIDALWLQLGQSLAGGARWRQCDYCGDPFPVGGRSGRRLVARFCSNEHRIRFRKRSKHSPAMRRSRSRWIATGICSRATTTEGRGTRSPRVCSRTLSELLCHPCAMCHPAQPGTKE